MANQNRYWTILTGIGNKKWDVFKQYNLVAIDVPILKSQGLEGRNTIDYFINEINLEDIIIAIIPNKFTILGVGRVKSAYISPQDPSNPLHHLSTFKDIRFVEWITKDALENSSLSFLGNLRDVISSDLTNQEYDQIKEVYSIEHSINLPSYSPISPTYSQIKLKLLLQKISKLKNVILYGTAGTGKTYTAKNFSRLLVRSQKSEIAQYFKLVTFHQSFSYEEFVEGFKPLTNGSGEIVYKVVDGVFKKICKQALSDPQKSYLIIIDEINRANIAKVFGELITLIEDDKRIGARNELKVTLPYAQEEFGVPKNLYILGTMNTSDRSIALLDIALRRRFTFIELKPDPELLKEIVIDGIHCDRLLTQLNKRITLLIGRDYQIGHSYFMNIENIEDLRFTWYHRIIPLLQEYFYHDSKRLSAVIGSEFMQPIDISDIPDTLRDFRGIETQYEIADLQGEDFTKALSKIA